MYLYMYPNKTWMQITIISKISCEKHKKNRNYKNILNYHQFIIIQKNAYAYVWIWLPPFFILYVFVMLLIKKKPPPQKKRKKNCYALDINRRHNYVTLKIVIFENKDQVYKCFITLQQMNASLITRNSQNLVRIVHFIYSC